MKSAIAELEARGKAAKEASKRLAYISTDIKNRALTNISRDLLARKVSAATCWPGKTRYWRPIKRTIKNRKRPA